jgi:hypothetical protein
MGRKVSILMLFAGMHAKFGHRTPHVILCKEKRIIAVLVGKPLDEDGSTYSWDQVTTEAAAAIEEAGGMLNFDKDDLSHRRGEFAAKAFGVLDGLGQKVRICRAYQFPY